MMRVTAMWGTAPQSVQEMSGNFTLLEIFVTVHHIIKLGHCCVVTFVIISTGVEMFFSCSVY